MSGPTKPIEESELRTLTAALKTYFSQCAIMRMEPRPERVAEILQPYSVEPVGGALSEQGERTFTLAEIEAAIGQIGVPEDYVRVYGEQAANHAADGLNMAMREVTRLRSQHGGQT